MNALICSNNFVFLRQNRNIMNFLEFHRDFIGVGCFNTRQVLARYRKFNRDNLTRWIKQGLLVKMRQSYYAFPEFLEKPSVQLYISNMIYAPSYVSMHSVFSFYEMTSAVVGQITAVTTLKTAEFKNAIGDFTYHTVRREALFGYEQKPFGDKTILMAYPEKAVLDLLYLFPSYGTEKRLREMEFDDYFMSHEFNWQRFDDYVKRLDSTAVRRRARIFKKIYRQ
jgi:predicted transcriptional regulator of viral defense system